MKRKRLARRLSRIEQRLTNLEANPNVSYDMPPAPMVDMDPTPPIAQPPERNLPAWPIEGDAFPGMYL